MVMKKYNMNPVFTLPIPGLMGTTGLLQGHPQRASSVTHKNVSTTYVPRRALVGCAQPMHINIFQLICHIFAPSGVGKGNKREREWDVEKELKREREWEREREGKGKEGNPYLFGGDTDF